MRTPPTLEGVRAQLARQGADIWYSPSHRYWWMEPKDATRARERLEQYPDAIHVTNAYDVLTWPFIESLMKAADR